MTDGGGGGDANVVRIAVRANSFVISVVMSVRCCCADYHTYILLAQKSRALCFFQSTGNDTNIM